VERGGIVSDTHLEQQIRILDAALTHIASRAGDCAYEGEPARDRPRPCDCARCVALSAQEATKSWRFHGSHYARAMNPAAWPREAKMHAAWSNKMDDHLLAKILREHEHDEMPAPSPRDWYVATSVVQWLATNVGMESILAQAGFKYVQWEQDAAREGAFR
jgi:hypothetical protein